MPSSNQTNRRSTAALIIIIGALFLLSAALIPLLVGGQQKALQDAAPLISPISLNKPAPSLELFDLQGKAASLEDYRGQVVLVNNWATWCPPCKEEMPELQAYYAAHAPQGFVVVSIESGEPAEQVADFVQEYGMTFPVWLDPNLAALDAFQNWNLPSSYVIDRDGMMRLSWTGGINQATLEHYLTPLLEEN